MTGTLIAVFVTSLLGSSHCAGMCGPFVILASGKEQASARQLRTALTSYHLGRLLSYSLLGAMAGLLGYGVLGFGSLVGMADTIIPLSGGLLVAYGLGVILYDILRPHRVLVSMPAFLQGWLKQGYRSSMSLAPWKRAATIGFYSGFLPCGWLYAFLMMALGVGSPLGGLSVVLVFWLGTLPALTGLTLGVRQLGGWFHLRKAELSAVACVVFGLILLGTPRPSCCQTAKETSMKSGVATQKIGECCHQ